MVSKRAKKTAFLCFVSIFFLVLFVCVSSLLREPKTFLFLAENLWVAENEPWLSCQFELPEQQGRVSYMIQTAHPFLAEYNQKILLNDKEFPLPVDGGGFGLKAFKFISNKESGRFYLLGEGERAAVIVDIPKKELVYEVNNFSEFEQSHIGKCNFDEAGDFKFYSAS